MGPVTAGGRAGVRGFGDDVVGENLELKFCVSERTSLLGGSNDDVIYASRFEDEIHCYHRRLKLKSRQMKPTRQLLHYCQSSPSRVPYPARPALQNRLCQVNTVL